MPPQQLAIIALSIFFSYAHEDEALRGELVKHLSILRWQGLITEWYDRDIQAGIEWEHEINVHLDTAQIILLLVSSDFLASPYCYSIEMTRALERHIAGEARVIPIILRPVEWERAPFSKLQVLPTDAQPVTSWSDRDAAFLNVTKGIRKAIEDLNIQRVKPQTSSPSTASTPATMTTQLPPWNVSLQRNPFFTGREAIYRTCTRYSPRKDQQPLLYPRQSVVWAVLERLRLPLSMPTAIVKTYRDSALGKSWDT